MSTTPSDSSDLLLGILAYCNILVLIPLLVRPKSQFVRFHTNQGFLLLIAFIACLLVLLIPFVGIVIGPLGFLAIAGYAIFGIFGVCNNEMKPLPFLQKIHILK